MHTQPFIQPLDSMEMRGLPHGAEEHDVLVMQTRQLDNVNEDAPRDLAIQGPTLI